MSLRRVAPLGGIVFVVLTVVAFAALGGSTPGIKDSPTKIATFYGAHYSKQEAAAHVLALAVAFLAVFAAACWPLIRDAGGLWSALFFGGGIITAGGFLLAASTHLALADGAHHGVEPAALQGLNALDADNYLAFSIGIGVLLVGAAGAMIPAGAAMKWLGWIALVLGILSFTPLGFIGFIGGGLWIAVMSVVLFMRGDNVVAPSSAAVPAQ